MRPDGDAPDSAPRDAGDTGRPDAGTAFCRAELVAGPVPIGFSPEDESADRPQAERRSGAFYLLHTMRGRDGGLTPYGNPFDDSLAPFGGLSSAIFGATEPYVTAASEERLGYCFDTRAGITVAGDGSPPLSPGGPATRVSYSFGGHCQDITTNARTWFVAFTSGLGPRGPEPFFMLMTPDLMGLTTMPAPAFRETFVDGREVRAATLPGGTYVYTAEPTRDRLLEVGVVDDSGVQGTFLLRDVPPSLSPPGISRWPFADDAIAIAHHFPEGVRVLVATRDGEELLRTEPLAFSMGGDVTPALAALPDGLVVAMLNYGDFDPNGGLLEIHIVDRTGTSRELFTVPTRRASLSFGGIEAVADGRRVLVHWADVDETSAEGGPRTQALILECFDP